MNSESSSRAAQRERTRILLLRIASRRFAQDGYAGTSLESIVAEAGLSRGAVYHQFSTKIDLFAAVVESAQYSVALRVHSAVSGPGDLLGLFLAGCRAFLEASLDAGLRRILLVDGPAVLGWDSWRAGDSDASGRLLDDGVRELAEAGILHTAYLDTLTTMISGALNEVAVDLAEADDAAEQIDETMHLLARMITALGTQNGA